MKKRALSILLTVCMLLTLLPTMALAENAENVASIGGQGYPTLANAVAAAQSDDTVKLLGDVTVGTMITLDKTITLDLNGYKISTTGNDFVQVINSKILTIDGTKAGSELYGRINVGIAPNSNGNVVLNGGIYSCKDAQTVLHINGTCLDSDVTIENATITSSTDNGIQLNGAGTFLIENSTITGATAVYVKSGTLTIRNSTLTGTKSPADYSYNGNGANATGDAIVVDSCNYPGGAPVVNIESGSFSGTKAAVGYYLSNGGTAAKISVTGGYFTSDPSAYLAEGYYAATSDKAGYTYMVKPGYAASITTTNYATLAGAVTAAQSGDTVKLLGDVTLDAGPTNNIIIDKGITIDGNGKIISRSFDSVAGSDGYGNYEAFFVVSSSGVTIKNVTFKALTNAMKDEAAIYVNANGTSDAKITFEDNTFDGNSKSGLAGIISAANTGAYLTVDGNTFNGLKYAAYFNGITNGVVTGNTVTGSSYNAFNVSDGAAGGAAGSAASGAAASVTFTDNTLTGIASADSGNTYGDAYNSGIYVGTGNTVKIESGSIAMYQAGDKAVYAEAGTLTITGGYFTSDPSAYLAEGKAAVESDKAGYTYMVADKTAAKADVVTGAPAVDATLTGATSDEQAVATAVKAALTAVTPVTPVTGSGINAAASTIANQNTVTPASQVDKLNTATGGNVQATDVAIAINTFMDVKVTDVTIAGNAGDAATMTLAITPMYQKVATTNTVVTSGTPIVLTGGAVNAVAVGSPQELTVTKPVTLNIPIAASFAAESASLYVEHVKSASLSYFYQGTVASGVLSVENPNGFSTFKVSKTNAAVAQIGAVGYGTLQAAVDAVANGQTIQMLADQQTASVGRTVSFTLIENGKTGTNITAGSNTKRTVTGTTYSFVYTAPSSSSGGGGGVSSYTLSFETNGGSAISAVSKTSGTTVDLTAYKPAKTGYTFGGWYSDSKLTTAVTSVKLTKNTTVYARWTARSAFADVPDGAYYQAAVDWAVEKGVTQGASATAFNPNGICTRAQAVTFLWRASGEPEPTSAKNPFTDVSADAYYYKAVLWAVEKGITEGTGTTSFSPDKVCTRAQIVTFQYRAAGSPATGTANPFTDVASDAYYANAVLWAVKEGVTEGTATAAFSPNADCTRAQIVTFLFRQLGK